MRVSKKQLAFVIAELLNAIHVNVRKTIWDVWRFVIVPGNVRTGYEILFLIRYCSRCFYSSMIFTCYHFLTFDVWPLILAFFDLWYSWELSLTNVVPHKVFDQMVYYTLDFEEFPFSPFLTLFLDVDPKCTQFVAEILIFMNGVHRKCYLA